jgi:hypothetical protein
MLFILLNFVAWNCIKELIKAAESLEASNQVRGGSVCRASGLLARPATYLNYSILNSKKD